MSQNHYNTKARTYKHLNYEERVIIQFMLAKGYNNAQIARYLGRSNGL